LQLPRPRPVVPIPPEISDYEAIATNTSLNSTTSSSRTRGNTQPSRREESIVAIVPTRVSDLTLSGQEQYKDDREDYKIRLEAYRFLDKEYQEEQSQYGKLVAHILATVSSHLQLNCCDEGKTVREWVASLQETVGTDPQEERDTARDQYLAALKPMKTPGNWESWLANYDQAATRAETQKVSEALNINDVTRDFLGAVLRVAPAWVATFSGPGYDRTTINRKKMMKLFREYMSQSYPSKGKHKSAFAAGEASYLAGGASDQDTTRDASEVLQRAPSALSQGNPGKSRQKRKFDGQETRSRQFPKRNTATAGGECPACGQRHILSECYYVYPEKAPEWFKPNRTIAKLVGDKVRQDGELRRLMNDGTQGGGATRLSSSSDARSSNTPQIKMSQTPDVQLE
jgi:hypothetical protein